MNNAISLSLIPARLSFWLQLLLLLFTGVEAFVPPQLTTVHCVRIPSTTAASTTTTCLAAASNYNKLVSLSTPSQAECESLGVREWPQQVKKGSWTESAAADATLVRYVLEGQGSVQLEGGGTTNYSLKPGTLLQVKGPATLNWQASTTDMILLTPNYEQGGLLLTVGGGLIALLVALVVFTSS